MNKSLFRNGEKLSVFVDVAAVEREGDSGGGSEQLTRLLDQLASGRSLHRATAYLSRRQPGSRESGRAQEIREIGFHVVEVNGAGVSVALAVDLVGAAEDADVLTIVSGDSSLEPGIAAARFKGARVEIVVCPGARSEVLIAAADSAVAIGELSSSPRSQRPGRPNRPRSSDPRLARPSQPRPAPSGRGRPRTSGPQASQRGREPERQEWPTPPPPSPEEMGIDPAARERPRPAGRPAPRTAPRPAPRSAPRSAPRPVGEGAESPGEESPPASAPGAPPSFTVLEGEHLSSPRPDGGDGGGGE